MATKTRTSRKGKVSQEDVNAFARKYFADTGTKPKTMLFRTKRGLHAALRDFNKLNPI